MKHINEYIDDKVEDMVLNEGLLSWLKKFISKVFRNQKNLLDDDGNVKEIEVNVNKMKLQKEPICLNDIDEQTKDMWRLKNVGYPEAYNILTNKQANGIDTFKNVYAYSFYYTKNSTYSAGLIIYNNLIGVDGIDNYITIYSIEYCEAMKSKKLEIYKYMLNTINKYLKERNPTKNFNGFSIYTKSPRLRNYLTDLRQIGFTDYSENDKYLIYNPTK